MTNIQEYVNMMKEGHNHIDILKQTKGNFDTLLHAIACDKIDTSGGEFLGYYEDGSKIFETYRTDLIYGFFTIYHDGENWFKWGC